MIYLVSYKILRWANNFTRVLKKNYLRLRGLSIGHSTYFSTLKFEWPHKVSIGNHCNLEDGIYFKHDGFFSKGQTIVVGNHVFIGRGCEFNIRQSISIGDDCLIASGCKFIDHDHGMDIDKPMRLQQSVDAPIVIEKNAWLGFNVIVLKGVCIGSGAIVAAGAVVTKSIPANEIWGGVPAKFIKKRE